MLDSANLSPWTEKKCLRLLYKTCGHHILLPKALQVLANYDRSSGALCHGGFGDVWKGELSGREVAVKVIRTYLQGELERVINVGGPSLLSACADSTSYIQKFCKEVVMWKFLQHPNVVPLIGAMMSEAQFAMVSPWMKNGNINQFVKANPKAGRLVLVGSPLGTSLSLLRR